MNGHVGTSSGDTELADRIRSMACYRGWESGAARRLYGCRSIEDLIAKLDDEDANLCIVAARLVGMGSLSPGQRESAVEALKPLLEDKRANEYEYGGLAADAEEAPTMVAEVAAEILNRLDPNWKRRSPK